VRRLSFDQNKFDTPDSEQSLDLAVSSSRQHESLAAFLSECGASTQTGWPAPAGWSRWTEVVVTVRERAMVELPAAERCEVFVLSDEWDELELAMVAGPVLLWYHWWTTA